MRLPRIIAMPLLSVALANCYHAIIETGATPSSQVVEQKWAASWLEGLIPPKTIETAAKCPGGVARIETKLSFLNRIAGFLTLGIYSPMHVTVTCAATSSADADAMAADLIARATGQAAQLEAINDAATRSSLEGRAVLVKFE